MAKKQTLKSLLGGSDEREQVELNLNPIALQPTIGRQGGNYRVAVQQTPKTNSALQLSQALKDGVGVYEKAVDVAQSKALQDVSTMSESDFDKFLNEGLDEESRNIFGYTKAYNQALAKKYYAEEMPTKLQAIASELHSDPYKYKTVEEFEAASMEAVNGAYDEADELLEGNVFGNQANNALKSATKADFVKKQQAVFLQKLPEITRTVQSDIAFKAFSELDDVANAKASIDQQILAVTDAVGNKRDAAAIVTKAYLDNIEALAKQDGKEELAQALIDELDDTTVAGLGSQGRRKFGDDNIELFNTATNRLKIEELENNLETTSIAGYNKKIANSKFATSSLSVELFRIIENDGEEAGLAFLDEIAAQSTKGTVTTGGNDYSDTVELEQIINWQLGARGNKDLFKYNHKLSFIQQNTGQKRRPLYQMISYESLSTKLGDRVSVLGKPTFDEQGRQVFSPSDEGALIQLDFEAELTRLEFALHDKYAGEEQAVKIDKFNGEYKEEVAIPLQNWLDARLESLKPAPEKVELQSRLDKYVPKQDQAEINSNPLLTKDDKEAILAEKADAQEALQLASNFMTNSDGTRELRDASSMSYTGSDFANTMALKRSFTRASAQEQWKDGAEKASGLDTVHSRLNTKTNTDYISRGTTLRKSFAQEFNNEQFKGLKAALGFEPSLIRRAEKAGKLREKLSIFGVTSDELINDSFSGVPLTSVFGNQSPFLTTPVLIDGSMSNTIKVVQDYLKNPTASVDDKIEKMASQYQMSVDTMMRQMESYLLQNGYFK